MLGDMLMAVHTMIFAKLGALKLRGARSGRTSLTTWLLGLFALNMCLWPVQLGFGTVLVGAVQSLAEQSVSLRAVDV